MSYAEAIQFLFRLQLFGLQFGLENTRQLAELAGRPQDSLRFIHVAGTNGKGSTCALLESIYRATGLRVGLYTSPHLVSFRERIQINREWISETEVARLVAELQQHLKQLPEDRHPTFFEAVTLLALRHFANQRCDLVIWETGLGGRLDATNIVTPLASVITNIGLDHQQWLGQTHAEIAREKAGIIKPGIPVITSTDVPEALAIIRDVAREQGSALTFVPPEAAQTGLAASSHLPLAGPHQRRNAALALTTTRVLQPLLPVSDEQRRIGLETVNWAARFQRFTTAGGTLIVDGAHNPEGAEVLLATLREEFPGQPFTLILGMLGDKDCERLCRVLAPASTTIIVVPVNSERSSRPEALLQLCQTANPDAKAFAATSLAEALTLTENHALTVVAGSLYLAGEALEKKNAFGNQFSERALNDWKPVKR